ncbi:MAG: riboflavin synthase [Armatimonadetes bacterium]|nr:riboflavin synthase [Armatimonadota bacterium]
MFTGLIQEVGEITDTRPRAGGRDLVLRAPGMASDLAVGESVAVNGVCLTVEACDAATFRAHAGEETLNRTTLSEVRVGSRLNLERALLPGQRLGGHFVQGHVDGVGSVRAVRPSGTTTWFEIDAPPELSRTIAPKGSIAIDGISLTVVECRGATFSVAIIPHTLAETNLGERRPGERVNLETDVLAKYVERLLAAREDRPGLTEDFLREHGF